ncbi:MAG: hypothetical protein LBE12_08435 [Planctomycetaceae bacterium]|jgi:hypothetical protein|nr:hypothetical protein [Planctomycetaceae bacterium]
MSRPHQTNKEFVEAAGIAEQDAFIAVAIRRIVGRLLEIPVRELAADMKFETVMRRAGFYTDWDALDFAHEFMKYFPLTSTMDIEPDTWEKGTEIAANAGYPNWFYNPDNYKLFSFLWKPFVSKQPAQKITFGEWVKLVIEIVLVPVRDKIVPPVDWTGIETSDQESDTVAQKSPCHNTQFIGWMVVFIVTIILLLYFLQLLS